MIAGMGSFLIAQILEKAPKDEHITYILQANDKVEYLRKYLMTHGFE
jgi:tRNA A22 N-methylase